MRACIILSFLVLVEVFMNFDRTKCSKLVTIESNNIRNLQFRNGLAPVADSSSDKVMRVSEVLFVSVYTDIFLYTYMHIRIHALHMVSALVCVFGVCFGVSVCAFGCVHVLERGGCVLYIYIYIQIYRIYRNIYLYVYILCVCVCVFGLCLSVCVCVCVCV